MKFIHCADLHLDSCMDALTAEKSRARREELIRSFERMVEFAAENSVRAIVIAGDMFDTRKVSAKTRGRILQTVESNSGIDFLYLSGNHDDDNFITALDTLPQNLKIFTDEWTFYRYGNTVITGVKFTSENVNVVYDTLNLDPKDKNIVVLHGQIAGYKTDDKAELISLPKLKNKNIDYLALGHIHSFDAKPLDERGVYCYSGCLEGRGFDELGDKGFVLVDTDGELDYKFVVFSYRALYMREFNVEGCKTWYDAREKLLRELKVYPETSLLKVVLTGDTDADFETDVESLVKELNEHFFFAKVYDKTELKINSEDYAADKSLKGEFVRAVMNGELDEETCRHVIVCGLNALKGKEI